MPSRQTLCFLSFSHTVMPVKILPLIPYAFKFSRWKCGTVSNALAKYKQTTSTPHYYHYQQIELFCQENPEDTRPAPFEAMLWIMVMLKILNCCSTNDGIKYFTYLACHTYWTVVSCIWFGSVLENMTYFLTCIHPFIRCKESCGISMSMDDRDRRLVVIVTLVGYCLVQTLRQISVPSVSLLQFRLRNDLYCVGWDIKLTHS